MLRNFAWLNSYLSSKRLISWEMPTWEISQSWFHSLSFKIFNIKIIAVQFTSQNQKQKNLEKVLWNQKLSINDILVQSNFLQTTACTQRWSNARILESPQNGDRGYNYPTLNNFILAFDCIPWKFSFESQRRKIKNVDFYSLSYSTL